MKMIREEMMQMQLGVPVAVMQTTAMMTTTTTTMMMMAPSRKESH
jgi:hypothetical protein